MWNAMQLVPSLLLPYTNILGVPLFFGIFMGVLVLGFWRRNRGVRLVSVVFVLISPFIMSSNAGLMIGIPGAMQTIGQALLAAGLAGIFLSFIKR